MQGPLILLRHLQLQLLQRQMRVLCVILPVLRRVHWRPRLWQHWWRGLRQFPPPSNGSKA
jgi:hypothetical protein